MRRYKEKESKKNHLEDIEKESSSVITKINLFHSTNYNNGPLQIRECMKNSGISIKSILDTFKFLEFIRKLNFWVFFAL